MDFMFSCPLPDLSFSENKWFLYLTEHLIRLISSTNNTTHSNCVG